jgi:hypothetical protein
MCLIMLWLANITRDPLLERDATSKRDTCTHTLAGKTKTKEQQQTLSILSFSYILFLKVRPRSFDCSSTQSSFLPVWRHFVDLLRTPCLSYISPTVLLAAPLANCHTNAPRVAIVASHFEAVDDDDDDNKKTSTMQQRVAKKKKREMIATSHMM